MAEHLWIINPYATKFTRHQWTVYKPVATDMEILPWKKKLRRGRWQECLIMDKIWHDEHLDISAQSIWSETDLVDLQEGVHLWVPAGFPLVHKDKVYQPSTMPGKRLLPEQDTMSMHRNLFLPTITSSDGHSKENGKAALQGGGKDSWYHTCEFLWAGPTNHTFKEDESPNFGQHDHHKVSWSIRLRIILQYTIYRKTYREKYTQENIISTPIPNVTNKKMTSKYNFC